jgi:sulfite oxidase
MGRSTPHRCTQSIAAGVDDPVALTEKNGIQKHLRMESLDGMKMKASINMEKATNPNGDVFIAYERNDEALPRDRGFPLRAIVPGYAAVRNVKRQVADKD